jgi:Terminase small subunit
MDTSSLTEREKKFLTAYFGLPNGGPGVDASKAIRAAGYTGTRANQAAYKMMQRPRVTEAVSRFNRARDANILASIAERDRKDKEDWERGRAERFARLHRRSSRR